MNRHVRPKDFAQHPDREESLTIARNLEHQTRDLRGVTVAIRSLAGSIAKDHEDDREEAEGIEILCSRLSRICEEVEDARLAIVEDLAPWSPHLAN